MEGSFHESQAEIFTSMPAVLFYNTFFLVNGEWTSVDFSEYGAILCMLYVLLFSLGVGTLPVALLIDALTDKLASQSDRVPKPRPHGSAAGDRA